jgi:D-alanyl-D-alanine carboxypeptidase/D-alanyl-D-alanine-endopeptidase (penicillin-binding protein 4)
MLRPQPRAVAVASRIESTPPPAPFWGAATRTQLEREVRAALAPALAGARDWSCIVLSQDGRVLYADRPGEGVEAASTQKLIVADAALAQLGPNYRFDTLLAAERSPADGAVDGNLWLEGSGDPSLRSRDLFRAVEALRTAGITRVHGAVTVDGSAIAGEEINPYWNPDDANEDFMAPTSGISLDEDTIEFHVRGTNVGEDARVWTKPATRAVRYSGTIVTGFGDDVIIAATGTPNTFRVAGSIPPGIEEKFWVPVHGIDRYAGEVLDGMLQRAGIAVGSPVQTGTVPLNAQILWEHRSLPLRQLVNHMLVFSDNHYAEQLMRTLGAQDGDTPDDSHGILHELHILREQGIPVPELHLVDGSGLAHADRVAALTLARILNRGDGMLYPLLPRGGKDGTLKMYQFSDALGRVRAKSGHLADASSLAGYVDTHRHGRVVFAFVIDGSPADPDAAIVAAVDRLARY